MLSIPVMMQDSSDTLESGVKGCTGIGNVGDVVCGEKLTLAN